MTYLEGRGQAYHRFSEIYFLVHFASSLRSGRLHHHSIQAKKLSVPPILPTIDSYPPARLFHGLYDSFWIFLFVGFCFSLCHSLWHFTLKSCGFYQVFERTLNPVVGACYMTYSNRLTWPYLPLTLPHFPSLSSLFCPFLFPSSPSFPPLLPFPSLPPLPQSGPLKSGALANLEATVKVG